MRFGCALLAVPSTLSPMLQHLRDMNSKLTSHDGSVNAETWEPLGLPSGGQCSSSGRDQQCSLLQGSAFVQSVLETVGVRK